MSSYQKAEQDFSTEKNGQEATLEESGIFEVTWDMESAETPEEFRVLVPEFLRLLEEDFNLGLSDDVGAVYQDMQDRHLLARLESVSRVLHSLQTGDPIFLGSEEDHYENAVIPENEGIRIAFAEGDAPGPVRLLMGFDFRSMIGFDAGGLQVDAISSDELDSRDTGMRAKYCRHVSGSLKKNDIKDLVLRIPRQYFPKDKLTEAEIKSESVFIFRAARL